jgi:hypothetical protein
MLARENVRASVDDLGGYRVRFTKLESSFVDAILDRIFTASGIGQYRLFDGDDRSQPRWATADRIGDRWNGLGVGFDNADGPFVEFVGEVTPEGDDRLDGTKSPTEINLDTILDVVSGWKSINDALAVPMHEEAS